MAQRGQQQGSQTSDGGRLDGTCVRAPVTSANFALGAGWGTTASVTSVATGSNDQRGTMTITSSGSGQAQATATVTMTYQDGAFDTSRVPAPVALVQLAVSSNAVTEAQPTAITATSTQLSWTHSVLPVSSKTYTYNWIVVA